MNTRFRAGQYVEVTGAGKHDGIWKVARVNAKSYGLVTDDGNYRLRCGGMYLQPTSETATRTRHDRNASGPDLMVLARLARQMYFPELLDTPIMEWREMTSLWGSCSYELGTVRINEALRMAPEWVLFGVIVHEVAHLIEGTHNNVFKSLVGRYPLTSAVDAVLSTSTPATIHLAPKEPAMATPKKIERPATAKARVKKVAPVPEDQKRKPVKLDPTKPRKVTKPKMEAAQPHDYIETKSAYADWQRYYSESAKRERYIGKQDGEWLITDGNDNELDAFSTKKEAFANLGKYNDQP